MSAPVEAYLGSLRRELQRLGVVEMYDALDDAREFLDSELWRCRTQRPELDEEAAFERVEEVFGPPDEIARAYKDGEGTGSPWQERIRRLRRFSYAPGWKVYCPGCKRRGDLEASSPLLLRLFARSWLKFRLGWCFECRRLRFLKLIRQR